MTTIIVGVICLIVGAVGGLLIGRKNPKAADTAAQFADSVRAAAEKK